MTAIDQLKELYPPCRICGTPWVADSEAEAQECLNIHEVYKNSFPNSDPTTFEKTYNIAWVCARCQFMSHSQREAEERKYRLSQLIENTYGYGRMPRCAMLHNFTQSSAEAEAVNPEQWAKARAWKNDCSLWIQGTKGTGKTFLSRCLLNWALDQGHSVYEVSAVDFTEWVYRQGEKQRLDAEAIDVLLLDDIDKPEWRIDSLVALWRLMDRRNNRKLHTLMTSNVSPVVLKGRWMSIEGPDRAVVEPMLDRMHGFQRITLEGKSLR